MSSQRKQSGVSLWDAIRALCGEERWKTVLERKQGSRSIIEGAWGEIKQKLLSGELQATGCIDGSLKPEPIAAEVWELAWYPHTIWPVPQEPSIVENRFSKSRSAITGLRLFGPLPSAGDVAERNCTDWLRQLVRSGPQKPGTRSELLDEAQRRFPGLSERGFDRAWKAEAPEEWKKHGRRSS